MIISRAVHRCTKECTSLNKYRRDLQHVTNVIDIVKNRLDDLTETVESVGLSVPSVAAVSAAMGVKLPQREQRQWQNGGAAGQCGTENAGFGGGNNGDRGGNTPCDGPKVEFATSSSNSYAKNAEGSREASWGGGGCDGGKGEVGGKEGVP